ncbi:MAG: LysE family translocator [Proteobacteria bacterium]|nr:LysE family translocator [Pseudomonadota bacterium]
MDIQHAQGITAFLAGILLGLSLAAPPGPILAVMAHEAMRNRVRPALLMAGGAMTGDAIWLGLAALGTVTLFGQYPRVIGALGLVGGSLLLWMAWTTFRAARSGFHAARGTGSFRLGLLTALTSPYSFAWWFANGALLVSSWGWPGIVGMFLALIVFSIGVTYAFRWLGRRFETAMTWVAFASAILLAGFAAYFLAGALRLLMQH